jgi:hypothetical protein
MLAKSNCDSWSTRHTRSKLRFNTNPGIRHVRPNIDEKLSMLPSFQRAIRLPRKGSVFLSVQSRKKRSTFGAGFYLFLAGYSKQPLFGLLFIRVRAIF